MIVTMKAKINPWLSGAYLLKNRFRSFQLLENNLKSNPVTVLCTSLGLLGHMWVCTYKMLLDFTVGPYATAEACILPIQTPLNRSQSSLKNCKNLVARPTEHTGRWFHSLSFAVKDLTCTWDFTTDLLKLMESPSEPLWQCSITSPAPRDGLSRGLRSSESQWAPGSYG